MYLVRKKETAKGWVVVFEALKNLYEVTDAIVGFEETEHNIEEIQAIYWEKREELEAKGLVGKLTEVEKLHEELAKFSDRQIVSAILDRMTEKQLVELIQQLKW